MIKTFSIIASLVVALGGGLAVHHSYTSPSTSTNATSTVTASTNSSSDLDLSLGTNGNILNVDGSVVGN